MLIRRKQTIATGPFCRNCGLGMFRKQMNHTLAFGWFGLISFFLNFGAIASNLSGRRKVAALAPPAIAHPGLPERPLFLRFGVYVALALFGAIGFFIVSDIVTSDAEGLADKCIAIDGEQLREVSCSSTHDGRVVAVLETDSTDVCPQSADDALVLDSDEGHVMCVDYDG